MGFHGNTPFSWATDDADFARDLEAALIRKGVREELCHVAQVSAEEKTLLDETMARTTRMAKQMIDGDRSAFREAARAAAGPGATICENCNRGAAESGAALQRCARCKAVWYCSTPCQRGDRECTRGRVKQHMSEPESL